MTPDFLNVSRRQFFNQSGMALGSAALGSLLARDLPAAGQASLIGHQPGPHFAPKAKQVIYLHMIGAPSQLDLFDYKPVLQKHDGQKCPEELLKGKRFAFIGGEMTLAGSPYKFNKHGQSGQELSELLPHLATVADEICLLKGMHTNEINHAPAQMFLHTGFGQGGRPSMGAWVTYGLGSDNRDMPSYVVLLSGPPGGAGTTLWSTGFLPSVYQGVQFRGTGEPVLFLNNPEGHDRKDRRQVLDAVRALNEHQLGIVGDPEISTRISQYEMAYRMQASVPELMDISQESQATLDMYGAQPGKASFANNCLLARRLVERGVRMVQLYDSDWDHHGGLDKRLRAKTKDVDQGMAALVRDLKQRGLLDETLVVWGGEFGRTPLRQGTNGNGQAISGGRDHHKDAYTMWMAGGGVKGGVTHGRTDEMGFNVIENGVHIHDLNATLLHLLGLDHERLTFRYQGRDFRLTDVHGDIVKSILA
ncbi:DUF1501 domain-containing protein [Prosthecobacter sp. SYSU 5D2]|uniref:DUF1501 domain-containing protein n=1 Tax=Prosthecobacter sp. SYSU 5D2 TaxID=3134134 RepID=UPI0031FF36B1